MSDKSKNSVIRYVITYMNHEDTRRLIGPPWGSRTRATEEEAAELLHNVLTNNSEAALVDAYGPQSVGTFKVSPCECWPGHFDAKDTVFDD